MQPFEWDLSNVRPLVLVKNELFPRIVRKDGQAKYGVRTVFEMCHSGSWIHKIKWAGLIGTRP
jgi:hypothetical protein